jgi:hypothetical protein
MLGLLNTLFFQQIGHPGDRRWNPSRFTVVDSTLARQSRDRTNARRLFVKENLVDLLTFRNYQFVRPLAERPEKERPEWMSKLSTQPKSEWCRRKRILKKLPRWVILIDQRGGYRLSFAPARRRRSRSEALSMAGGL